MARKVILVVENDEKTTQLVASALKSRYQLLCVSHGEKAIALAERETLHLALISRDLPDLGGLQLLGKMAAQFPAVPLIFIAENASKDFIVTAFRSGAKDFLEKPIAASTLLESVSRVLGSTEPENRIASFEAESGGLSKSRIFRRALAKLPPINCWVKQMGAFVRHAKTKLLASPIATWRGDGESSQPTATLAETLELKSRVSACTLQEDKACELLARMYCLGRFKVLLHDQPVTHWPCRKGKEIFAYLAINHTRKVHREIFMDTFWPASTPDSARNSLNVAIHNIRHCLHQLDPSHEYILYDEECYFFNPEIELWLDIEEFQHYWRLAQNAEREKQTLLAVEHYELAAALYQGDFMDDEPYESWPTQQRENLKEIYLVILDRLSDHFALDGHPDLAIDLSEKILEKDLCREDVYRRLMKCHYRLGHRDKAIKTFQKCTEALKSELEVEPTSATYKLYQQIRQDYLSEDVKTKVLRGK